jgi:pimeloyl-ACP methyl ester carboxylesterase
MYRSPISTGPHGFVHSGGEQIYFESHGAGVAVILCHGMGGSHAVWYQQVAHLAERFEVITWDQRGFGRSTALTGELGPGPAVTDIAAILDHLEIDRAHVVGQSMGGWSALGFALDHPDRTISLVLADTIGGIFTDDIRRALSDYGAVVAAGPAPDMLPVGEHPAIGGQLALDDLAQAFLYSQLGSLTDPPSPLVVMGLLMATDHTARIGGLTAPTLFVVGESDPIFPPRLIRIASALVAGSRVAVVSDAGHSPYFERPHRWNAIVGEFLQRSN